jgi:hypothetical protein
MLDELLGSWHWRNKATAWVDADPATVFLAAGQVRLGELPGASVRRSAETHVDRSGVTVLHDLLTQGFVMLHEEPDREIVLGRVGKFWQPGGAPAATVGGRKAFMDFAEPGYAKAVLSMLALPSNPGTMLVVETRIRATDDHTFQEFNRHWLVGTWVHPTARRQLLTAIKARVAQPTRG